MPWPLLAAAIPALATVAGGILGNAASARQAQAQRNWEGMMSDTAHRREVEDLKAAGLNPILSASGGSGASSPSGASAQQSDVIGPAVSSGMQGYRLQQELQNMKKEVESKDAGIANVKQLTIQSEATTQKEMESARAIKIEADKNDTGRPWWTVGAAADYSQKLKNIIQTSATTDRTEQEIKNLITDAAFTRQKTLTEENQTRITGYGVSTAKSQASSAESKSITDSAAAYRAQVEHALDSTTEGQQLIRHLHSLRGGLTKSGVAATEEAFNALERFFRNLGGPKGPPSKSPPSMYLPGPGTRSFVPSR